MTVRELSLRMSTRELSRWEKYQRTVGFPTHRLQLQLALVALVVARTMGGASEASLDEFVVKLTPDPEPKQDAVQNESVAAEAFAGIGGRRVRVLGQRRKRKG